eukprot:CAMPEP_0204060342 /NCGR_PEP_ID=MMETSP0360-20130528/139742_1 /ASSEMBLY_ACC=CAM_ASM_000342 /TAXON_ID=268821 /ORGANISM="Scrippsiella Hangoei, Strain SHTV-5" /LENGTH=67 /DNA_ID=CAMNT_0051008005 /DNA_START=122 /DNA_END=322 /DNA_ORIENTATION=-
MHPTCPAPPVQARLFRLYPPCVSRLNILHDVGRVQNLVAQRVRHVRRFLSALAATGPSHELAIVSQS